MTRSPVQARVAAVKEIAHGVTSYERRLQQTLDIARRDLNQATAEFQATVLSSNREVLAAARRREGARAELARCRENCGHLERALADATAAERMATQRHAANKAGQAAFELAAGDLRASLTAAAAGIKQSVPAARRHIDEYAEILTHYLQTGVS